MVIKETNGVERDLGSAEDVTLLRRFLRYETAVYEISRLADLRWIRVSSISGSWVISPKGQRILDLIEDLNARVSTADAAEQEAADLDWARTDTVDI